MSSNQQPLLDSVKEDFSISISDTTPRLGYDFVAKFEVEDKNTKRGFVVISDNDTAFPWRETWADRKDDAIANFLSWCRLRRGVKTWEAWQKSGYRLTRINKQEAQ